MKIVLAGLIALICVGALFYARSPVRSESFQTPDTALDDASGFTVSRVSNQKGADGRVSLWFTSVRYIQPDGNFLEEQVYATGKRLIHWSTPDRRYYIYRIGAQEIFDTGDLPVRDSVAERDANLSKLSDLRKQNPVETVSGIRTWVLLKQSGDLLSEMYISPELGVIPLRQVDIKDGQRVTVIDTVSVVRGKPDAAAWDSLKRQVPDGLPVVAK
ncbi:MAG TPA: hypothetical protein VNQ79_15980 [Blastocatellia bacterium]|nr:hypothetical protein [Blastocatellia bacterium]